MALETLLFDFDGTLANTLPLTIYGMQTVFAQYDGRRLSATDIIAMFGPTEDGMIKKNLHNKEQVQAAIACYYDIYASEHRQYVERDTAIIELLELLKRRQLSVGIITGKSRRSYRLSEDALGLSRLVEHVITGDDVVHPKPNPEGIIQMIENFHANPATTIYIGDSNSDVVAGKAAGIQTAAVQWMALSQSGSYPAGPDYFWTDVRELIQLVLEEN
ncbi:MAG: HAD family hydrolase [Sporolactobacillus sp.]